MIYDIFKLRKTNRLLREKCKLNLEIPTPSPATFGTTRLRSYGPKITSDNLNSFKSIIKCWNGNHCTCRVCEHTISRQ